MQLKKYSEAPRGSFFYYGPADEVNKEDLWGFLLVQHDNSWELAHIEDKMETEVKVSLLSRSGARTLNFEFPDEAPTVIKQFDDILSIVTAETTDDFNYKIKREHQTYANKQIQKR